MYEISKLPRFEAEIEQSEQYFQKNFARFQQNLTESENARNEQVAKYSSIIQTLRQERDTSISNLNTLIREQQEKSFTNINTAKWTPKDETQVKDELDAMKRRMKAVSKDLALSTGVENLLLNPEEKSDMTTCLREMIEFTGKVFVLPGMKDNKKAGVIINSILAHKICMDILRNSFFIFRSTGFSQLADLYKSLQRGKLRYRLGTGMTNVISANQVEAETWRAQTLRLLRPQLSGQMKETET